MKQLRVTATPDPEHAPTFFNVLSNSPEIEEARAVDWNMAAEDATTLLYAIDGDAELFAASALETPGIDEVDLSAVEETPSYALVRVRPSAIPLLRSMTEAMARAGLVVRKPVRYRDGSAHSRIVGEAEPIQAALDEAPGVIDVRIDEIGRFPGEAENPATTLTDRQREAVEAGLEMGYYESPRSATHKDIAEDLGCAPSTASDHLKKAEAKLVAAGMKTF